MPRLFYDRDRVAADLYNSGPMSAIATRLQRWRSTEDDNGLALVRDLIETASGMENSLWRLDIEKNVPLFVLAAFSCDESGFLTYNGELTLSMVIDGRFEIADTGISTLEDLADLTGQHDGAQRIFTLLDAVTAHLDVVLARALRFAQQYAPDRGDDADRTNTT
ncbi:hypothetical protein [Nocardia sp. NPDC059691]|uniref:hypothetical protein n=1 Tax=Nocardia sp. NPDC059691 TaxID=3346908 RepID=UPI00369476D2